MITVLQQTLAVTSLIILLVVAAGCIGGGSNNVPFDQPDGSTTPQYEVVSEDDTSFSDSNGKVVQLSRSVRTTPDAAQLNESQTLAVGKSVIAGVVSGRDITEIKIFLYADSVDVGATACRVVTWAPGGEFGNAQDVDPGDYSQNEFSVQQFYSGCNPPTADTATAY